LKGASNWLDYKEIVLTYLLTIGLNWDQVHLLSPIDRLKIGNMIRNSSTAEPLALIKGLKDGSGIIAIYDQMYAVGSQKHKRTQNEDLFDHQYDGKCPVAYASKFRAL
jgi:hypothetical protein